MFANIGLPGLILIVLIALIIFGPKKLPEIGKAAGNSLKEFKTATDDLTGDVVDEVNETKEIIKGKETK